MYFISETRYNPRTQRDEFYYRIKGSFRDLTGRPRHRLMLTVGFIDEELGPYDIRDIGRCLTWLHENQGRHDEGGDHYLEISSPANAVKETSMNRLFKERFEAEMTKARDALAKKGGKKTYEKVIERVGRAIQKYPSISKYYVVDYVRDEKNPKNMADIKWRVAIPGNVDKQSGIYFLRTNREKMDEAATWDYYNLIREIECTNRQLKTDLQLRPIHH